MGLSPWHAKFHDLYFDNQRAILGSKSSCLIYSTGVRPTTPASAPSNSERVFQQPNPEIKSPNEQIGSGIGKASDKSKSIHESFAC
jgi:hypothetical protein